MLATQSADPSRNEGGGIERVREPQQTRPSRGDISEQRAQGIIQAVYEGWQRDTSRLDAVQIRIRLLLNGDYFQFLTVVIPAPELRRLVGSDQHVTREQLWWHIAQESKTQVWEAAASGEIPKSNPTMAYELELFEDQLERAVRQARRDATKREARVGGVLYEFNVPTNPADG